MQQVGRPQPRDEAEVYLGLVKPGLLGRYPEVACRGELAAPAEGEDVHRRQDRLGMADYIQDGLLTLLGELPSLIGGELARATSAPVQNAHAPAPVITMHPTKASRAPGYRPRPRGPSRASRGSAVELL